MLAVVIATAAEAFGALLFWRAIVTIGNSHTPVVVWGALGLKVLVWVGFLVGVEFFLAYTSESTFRELLALALLMIIVIAVGPADPGHDDATAPGHR